MRTHAHILAAAVGLFSLASLTSVASASTLSVTNRLHHYSTEYYTNTQSEWHVTYANRTLPWGARVFLRDGLQRQDNVDGTFIESSPWNDLTVSEMYASGPYEWIVTISKQVEWRGSSYRYSALDFVIQIVLPDGSVSFDRGSSSTMGYMATPLVETTSACDPWLEAFCPANINVVEHW